MFMSPYVPGNENTEVMDGFNQFPPSMEPSTGLRDIATGLGNMSLAGFQQTIPVGPSMVPSNAPFGGLGHNTQWRLVPWTYAHPTPQVATVSYPNLIPRGPSTPAPSSSSFTTMSPMSSDMSMMTPFSSHHSQSSVMSVHHDFSEMRPSQGHYRSDGRRQNATRISRGYFSPPGPHHNHVDIQKIREGTDVRTTVGWKPMFPPCHPHN